MIDTEDDLASDTRVSDGGIGGVTLLFPIEQTAELGKGVAFLFMIISKTAERKKK
jgi:hypothetical protein